MSSLPAHAIDDDFWSKAKKVARKAGSPVIGTALKLYFAVRDPDTPAWARGVILGALAYFIAPVDAIPDLVPLAGYTDDWSVLLAALATVGVHVKPEHSQKAKEKLDAWFG